MLDNIRRQSFLADFTALEEEKVLNEVRAMIAEGFRPAQLLPLCLDGLKAIGRLYETQGYFVAGLIIADDMMRSILDLVAELPDLKPINEGRGRIVVGTIEGDIHDLGKNVAGMFLRANGYEVIDLGVDVPPAMFLGKTLELQPDLVAISILITSSFAPLKRAVNLLKKEIPPDYHHPFVAVGGGLVDEHSLKALGADAMTGDFENTLKLCDLVCRRNRPQPSKNLLWPDSQDATPLKTPAATGQSRNKLTL